MALSRRRALHALSTCFSFVGLGIAVFGTGLRERLSSGLDEVDRGDPLLLGLAALAFVSTLTCCGLAWRAGLAAAGARGSATDAVSRYVTGSLVNSLVPLRAGGAVRLTLYLQAAGSVRVVAGVAASIGALRAATLALLVGATSMIVPLSAWPVVVLVGGAAVAAAASLWLGRGLRGIRATVAWVAAAAVARVTGAALVASAFAAPDPLLAGLAIVAAMELAATLPLTPGNVALSTAAVAFVLSTLGLPSEIALAAGLSLAMLETATAVVMGACGLGYLTGSAAIRDRAGRRERGAGRSPVRAARLRLGTSRARA